jgi:hypothetical protein
MSAILGILGTAVTLVLVALIAIGIVAFHRGHLTFPTIVHTYTAFLLAIAITLTLCGGALVVKSIASAAIGRDFSYQAVDFPYSGPPGAAQPPGPTAAERARIQAGDDVTAGITLLIIGIALGVTHAFGNAIAARRDTMYSAVVERGFAVAMLAVGTVVGLASSAILLNDLLRRYVVTVAAPEAYSAPRPGGSLGFALLFVPLWVFFAHRVWRALTAGDAKATPANSATDEHTSQQTEQRGTIGTQL